VGCDRDLPRPRRPWHPRLIRRLATLIAVLATFATTATASAKQLVRYDVSGGLAGRSEHLVIDGDRTAKQTGSRGSRDGSQNFKVSTKQLRALKRDLKAARFSSLRRVYRPDYVVNDGLAETVTYKGHRVVVYTGADFPARLHTVIRRLGRLMRY
jgi:hypothetical protein